ncbi:MAG TPA: PIG-L family deacetylase [Candidatus Saccharimonadales bacterium]|nr:PIG-L family deacetylase [Candidatus Saccharimonadales bacterium]
MAVPPGVRILGVFAHPDDEVFVAGGTLAKYAARGAEAMVLSATRGQAGQIRDASAATRHTLGAVREQELRRACTILGVQHVACLDYMDGALREADFETLVGTVTEAIREYRPDIVITFGEDGAYGHPDHVTISAATTRAFDGAGLPAGARLYHSHFARSRLLMLDRLARWLVSLEARFRGGPEFVRSLSLFAEESTTLRYAGDFIEVRWFPAGTYIVEQGEVGTSLFLIVSGTARAADEPTPGELHTLRELGPGEFFGELALVYERPRSAHVIALDAVTCLVFSPAAPTAFEGRGPGASLTGGDAVAEAGWAGEQPTAAIDVTAHVDQKIRAIAAHRTQFPIEADLFPKTMLQEMLGREYFVRVVPRREVSAEL